MDSKSIFASKTFWFNVLSLAVVAGSGSLGVTIPPKVAVPLVTIGNLGLRWLTNQPVSLP